MTKFHINILFTYCIVRFTKDNIYKLYGLNLLNTFISHI